MLKNTREEYGLISRILHWLAFLVVVGMLLGGQLLGMLPDGSIKSIVVSAHKSLGVLVFFLMVVRLFWRLANPRPRFLGNHLVLRYVSEVLHVCLYVLLLVQPLAGILMSQAYGYPVVVFGWIEIPTLVWHSPSLGGIFSQIHSVTAMILVTVIVVHSAAALKHHYIDGDRTLMRMLKGG
jgi:cytochrome b561